MNIYSCWLPSHLRCRRTKKGAPLWMCVGGGWWSRVVLLQTETMDFRQGENWVHIMLQNEYTDETGHFTKYKYIEFQGVCDAIRAGIKSNDRSMDKSRGKFIYRTRKTVDAGKFISLSRPSNGWLHLQLDCVRKVNVKNVDDYLNKNSCRFGYEVTLN